MEGNVTGQHLQDNLYQKVMCICVADRLTRDVPVDFRERTHASNSVLFRRLISPMLSSAPA